MGKVKELVEETNTDYEDIRKHYKVESTSNMTKEQLQDCIKNLEKKKGKIKNGK